MQRRTASRVLLWGGLTLLPTVGMATVGGPSSIEVLGYDETDAKVYVLEQRHDESGDLPTLMFFAIRGPDARHPVRVRSEYAGESNAVEAAFPERLRTLKARLAPIRDQSFDGIAITTRDMESRPCTDQSEPHSAETLRAATEAQRGKPFLARMEVPGPSDPGTRDRVTMCRITEIDIRWGVHKAERMFESWGGVTLTGAWIMSDPKYRLVRLRHVGHTFESGYEEDVMVLLEAAPGDLEPLSVVSNARHARCQASIRAKDRKRPVDHLVC